MKINFETKSPLTVLKEQIQKDYQINDPRCILRISRYSDLNIAEIVLHIGTHSHFINLGDLSRILYQEIFKSKPIESVHPSKKKWGLSFERNKFPTLFIKLHRRGCLQLVKDSNLEFFTVEFNLSELENELEKLRKIYEN